MQSFATTTLTTERLQLRPFREADAVSLFEMLSDPAVTRYLSHAAWTSPESAHASIARDIAAMAVGEYARFAVERRADARVVGQCSLFSFSPQSKRAEIGYVLRRDAWGAGLMHEALTCLLDFGFGELQLHRVEADVDPRNEASVRSLERLGFAKEGHLRERWIVEGEVSDTGLYGLLAREWQARRRGRNG